MGEQRIHVRRDAAVKRLSAAYLEDKQGRVKPSTLECYQRNIRCHILPEFGSRIASELTAAEIDEYLVRMQENRISPKLVREVGTLFLAILKIGGIDFTEDVVLPRVRQRPIEVFTEPELKQLGQIILRRPDEMGLSVLLTLYTGIRLGELCGLRWQDVDEDSGMLHIQRTVERIAQEGGMTVLTVQTPKSESSKRWIPIPQDMMRLLLDVKHRQPEQYLVTGGETLPDPRTCQNRYRALLKRCGIRYRNFHALRHTYATRCIERGMDAKSVSELLGHSDVRTTLRLYVHSSLEYKRRVIESISFIEEEDLWRRLRRHFSIRL